MLEPNFSPFPEITSARLRLREINASDADAILFLRGNEKIMKYIGKPLCKNQEEALAHINKMQDSISTNTGIFWGIAIKEDPALLGVISFHIIDKTNYRAEIGYILHDAFWGKGIISEAIGQVIDFGFQKMGLHSIEAKIDPLNEGSRKILLKFHFQKEAYFRENYYFNGKFLDTEIYSLIKE